MLWDAIFATDYHDFSLVNYIFVALLTYLRDDILKMDNSGCLRLLMQPHYHLDVLEVLKTALYLQNPAVKLFSNNFLLKFNAFLDLCKTVLDGKFL